ncbi:hypothetical protein VKT23_019871 [Stygiomarasmius scandens]|uniref:Nephrocystin 3-like N-terminal domain-containing protein n=1 Tax=Marasmiellus scandens TaxID=2682957 RepID=A0ABR1IN84_9AGAR
MSSKKSKLSVPGLLGRFRSRSPSPQPVQPSQPNPDYSDIVGQISRPSTPTLYQRMRGRASTAHAGLTQIVQGLYDCSDMFLPLKTAAGVFLTIDKIVDRVRTNREELEQLENKLKVILSIVQKYKEDGLMDTLTQRIEMFCQAIKLQTEAVQDLQKHPLWVRTAEGTKDAEKIRKVFQNMSILCDAFQMDIQLDTTKSILQHLHSTKIDRLDSEMTSYKTRESSYGDPNGCLPGTRIKILVDLEAWALNENAAKVYWLVGMAGTGKSTISHSLCEILDEKQMLGASVFCSRGSAKASNANLIISAIAYALASNSPVIKANIVKALEDDRDLASPTYHNLKNKFTKLIREPIGRGMAPYKTVIIDALDECSDLQRVQLLLKTIIDFASKTPLKFFIASRDEDLIRMAFRPKLHTRDIFVLHEVEKDVVRVDIEKYLTKSLSDIPKRHAVGMTSDGWPVRDELLTLLDRSGVLFIYAATVVRYERLTLLIAFTEILWNEPAQTLGRTSGH